MHFNYLILFPFGFNNVVISFWSLCGLTLSEGHYNYLLTVVQSVRGGTSQEFISLLGLKVQRAGSSSGLIFPFCCSPFASRQSKSPKIRPNSILYHEGSQTCWGENMQTVGSPSHMVGHHSLSMILIQLLLVDPKTIPGQIKYIISIIFSFNSLI